MTNWSKIKAQTLDQLQCLLYGILVMLSVVVVLPMLVLAYVSSYYDHQFNLIFGERIRAVVSRRLGFWLVPLLPFYVLTWPYLGTSNIFVALLWFVIGVMLVEVHSVCLHRESWIAAFEPEIGRAHV